VGQHQDDVLVLSDLAAVKALADPLRHKMLELLERPRTVRELAARLGRPADRLYYHLRILERHGLVRATVANGGGERRYELAADGFLVAPELRVSPATVDDLVGHVLDRVRAEYRAGRAATPDVDGQRRTMLSLRHVVLTDDERAELQRRLEAVTDDFLARDRDNAPADDGRRTYGVVAGLWPVVEDES
jgi:DNA-binding transcriptional ArsR family regulator